MALDTFSNLAHISDTFGYLYTIDFESGTNAPLSVNKTLSSVVYSVNAIDSSFNSQIVTASTDSVKV